MKKFLQKLFVTKQRKIISRSRKYTYFKNSRHGLDSGFTLIELLVASLIAVLLVLTLFSFLIGVLDSDRKQTAKANAQEELQAAINYIADDLQEATYIYGSDSLLAINDQLPHRQGIANGDSGSISTDCNSSNQCTPVLVFWKRHYYDPASTQKYTRTGASQIIGCMPYIDNPTSAPTTTPLTNCTSNNITKNPYQNPYGMASFTNSLVAYYLKNDASLGSTTWSNTARILRWELKDGYVWYCSTGGTTSDAGNCPTTTATNRDGAGSIAPTTPANSPLIITPVVQQDINNYFIVPDKGFNRISFTGSGSLSSQASAWKKFDYFNFTTNPFVTLVDLMDDTLFDNTTGTQGGNSNAAGTGSTAVASAVINIPIGKNITIAGVTTTTNPDCDDPSVGVGNTNPLSVSNPTGAATQRVPADLGDFVTSNPSQLSSFFACVAPESVTARVYLRGNALARLASPPLAATQRKPTSYNLGTIQSFFPTIDVRSFGRSAIGIKQ